MQFLMSALPTYACSIAPEKNIPAVLNLAASVTTTRGMLFACWAIVIVLLAMAFAFLRSNKKDYALAILPLMITPFVHIFSGVIAKFLEILVPLTAAELRVIIDLTAGLVSCLLIGLATLGIKEKKRVRCAFFWCCAGFVVILTIVLVTNTMVTAQTLI